MWCTVYICYWCIEWMKLQVYSTMICISCLSLSSELCRRWRGGRGGRERKDLWGEFFVVIVSLLQGKQVAVVLTAFPVCVCLPTGKGDGETEDSVPAGQTAWPRGGWDGAADDQCQQRYRYKRTHTHTHIYTWLVLVNRHPTHTHKNAHASAHLHAQTHGHVHIHTHTHKRIKACTHAYTQARRLIMRTSGLPQAGWGPWWPSPSNWESPSSTGAMSSSSRYYHSKPHVAQGSVPVKLHSKDTW